MRTAIEIVKSNLLPKLGKVSNFDIKTLSESFWVEFTDSLLISEANPKAVYKLIFGLELDSELTEKIVSKIPGVFSKLVKELAEEYVLGNNSKDIEVLLSSKDKSFKTEVEFFYALNKSIQITERNRLKKEIHAFLKENE